jgi:hypothetical protein
MNKKDIVSLMEAYDEIAMNNAELSSPVDSIEAPQGGNDDIKLNADYAELKDLGKDQQKMAVANLQSLRSHAYEILSVLENGVMVEQWMDQKIAIANEYIVSVANAIMYRK